MVEAKSQDALAECQTVHFKKCFKQWHEGWSHCMISKEPTLKETTLIIREALLWRNKSSPKTISSHHAEKILLSAQPSAITA
jgi:hypothetical protein